MYNFPKNKNGDPYDKNPYLNNEQSTVLKTIPNSNIKIGYEWGNKDPWVVFVNNKDKKNGLETKTILNILLNYLKNMVNLK